MFGILLHVGVKMENISKYYGFFSNYVTFDEITKSYGEEAEIIPTNCNEKRTACKM